MSAAARVAAPGVLSRFRGALVGSVLGDCIGGEFEGAVDVPLDRVLQHLSALEDETRGEGILQYSDDTAMMRCVADSLLTRMEFDERDMARRFAKEYNLAPGRGYGSGVVQVLRKLASPHLKDVFQPAQAQFGGRGSFGNGGAMRAAPFALAFKSRADVCKSHCVLFHRLSLSEFPYCSRLHRVKELIDRNSVSIEEVISELGNGIAALESVPTAIFCVLHCLEPRDGLPERFGGLERTIAYSLALGGDTDTIACMAGAIAGAHYGIDSIPQSWQKSCEAVEEADDLARRLYDLYCLPQFEEDRGTSSCENNQLHTYASDQHTTKTD
ncbi:hypothetical protein cypCar_00030636 [Cyprinus carpio]|nr:hypothetical protein cypCar_00030636 [Cyprinus carpio]